MKKKFLQKVISVGLVGSLALCMAACSNGSSTEGDAQAGGEEDTATEAENSSGVSDSSEAADEAADAETEAEAGAEVDPYEFYISYGGTPSSSMVAVMEKLCEELSASSGGAFTFNQYNDNDYKESQALDELSNNIVDIVYLGSAAASTSVTDVAYLGMPGSYRYTDDADSFKSFEEALSGPLTAIYEKYGIHYLGLRVPAKMAIVGNGDPATTPEALKGKIVRVSGTWMGKLAVSMDLATTDVGLSELATALQRNTIDACITGIEQVYSQMLGEVVDYACVMPETDGVGALVMNQATWDNLNDAQRAAVDEAVANWMDDCLEVSNDFYDTSIAALEEYDVDIHYLTDEECNAYLETVDQVYEEIDASASEDGIALKEAILGWREANTE